MPALGDDLNDARRVEELERTARRLQRQLAQAKAKSAELVEATYQAAHDAAVVVGRPKHVPAPKHKAGTGDPEHAVVILTDWQLGKRTESYNTDVCIARIRHVVERVRRITAIHRKDHPVPECTVVFQGDHVEGTGIFEGQAWEVDSTGYAQLLAASSLMAEVVLTLLQDFERVHVHSVHGNHGRLGRRGQMPREDNLDLIAYAIARSHLSEQGDRVVWAENTRWYDHVQIGNLSALVVHGDQIKGYTAGTPASAIARRFTAWSSSMPFRWSEGWLGHYHQNIVVTLPNGAMVRMTPSTESGSVYAAEMMAAAGRAGQRLMYVHPEKGSVTSEYMVWLD